MKKLIVILTLMFTLIVAGVLYGTQVQTDEEEKVILEQAYMNQYPNPVPDFIPDPIPDFVLY